MRLLEQYEQQDRWRRWDEALAVLPLERREKVLDLGCGVGQVASRLARLGAEVIAVDRNEELLEAARKRHPHLRFERMDLDRLEPTTFGPADGLWASFVPAYFPDLQPTLRRWRRCLRPGGWLAMVEMDDLFAHDPLRPALVSTLREFYEEAREEGRYDFESGRRLADAARGAGFELTHESLLVDDELCFSGPATETVLAAWTARLQRMGGLQKFFRARDVDFEHEFLATLISPDHQSRTRVFFVIAQGPALS
jgi:SAM-dependent methyltransferase